MSGGTTVSNRLATACLPGVVQVTNNASITGGSPMTANILPPGAKLEKLFDKGLLRRRASRIQHLLWRLGNAACQQNYQHETTLSQRNFHVSKAP